MHCRVAFIEEKTYMDAFAMKECVMDEEKVDREKFSWLTRAAYLKPLREFHTIIYAATSTLMLLTPISSNLSVSELVIPKVCVHTRTTNAVLPLKRSEWLWQESWRILITDFRIIVIWSFWCTHHTRRGHSNSLSYDCFFPIGLMKVDLNAYWYI